MPVDGDLNNIRWLFWGGNGRYLLGDFDGRKFTPETQEPLESVIGNYYAAQTYSDIPESDGRRIQIAWMAKGKFPDMPFNQQMSIPCELTLRTLPEGIRLCRVPVREIKKIRGKRYSWKNSSLKRWENLLCGISGELFEIQAEFELGDASQFGFKLRGTPVVYNIEKKTVSCESKTANLTPVDKRIKLHILVDRTSIEIFANDGRASIFHCRPLDACNNLLNIFAHGGRVNVKRLDVWKLKSTWR